MAAVFSSDGVYRYALRRRWLLGSGRVCFVMLNPSTADASHDDPTVRRCIRFAQTWGYRELLVLNLFAWRSTDPHVLSKLPEPEGPDNGNVFAEFLPSCDLVICAWGAHGALRGQGARVFDLIRLIGKQPMALGVCKNGEPAHPLYLRGTCVPVEYSRAE